MKKIIIILTLLISSLIYAKQGDLSISISASSSSGSGFGLNYSITKNLRVKGNILYLAIKDYDTYNNLLILGGSANFDFKRLSDQLSSVYIFLGTEQIILPSSDYNKNFHIYSVGMGVRKFVDRKMYWELELGYGLYRRDGDSEEDYYDDNKYTMISGGFGFGYQF